MTRSSILSSKLKVRERGKVAQGAPTEPVGGKSCERLGQLADPKSPDEWKQTKVHIVPRIKYLIVCREDVVKMRDGGDVP